MSHLVGNPEDRFSRVTAQIMIRIVSKLMRSHYTAICQLYTGDDRARPPKFGVSKNKDNNIKKSGQVTKSCEQSGQYEYDHCMHMCIKWGNSQRAVNWYGSLLP